MTAPEVPNVDRLRADLVAEARTVTRPTRGLIRRLAKELSEVVDSTPREQYDAEVKAQALDQAAKEIEGSPYRSVTAEDLRNMALAIRKGTGQ